MREYPNYYECLKEAQDRLNRTIVLYGDLPYWCFAITDHKSDGIFRMWLYPIGKGSISPEFKPFFNTCSSYNPDYPLLGGMLDEILDKNPECGILRKHMNSPKFKRFRPFPLGMCNVGTQVYYVERQPIRPAMQQGLTKSAVFETLITAGSRQDNPTRSIEMLDIFSPAFKDCILGDYHSPQEVLKALLDPTIANDAHAFSREFALVRGPLNMIFLAYRTDIIGILPKNTFDFVKLGSEFGYLREVVQELDLFQHVI